MVDVSAAIAAALSPLAMTVGFIVWGDSWKGSAYTLNLFKCTLASFIFLIITFSLRNSTFSSNDVGMILLSSFLGIIIGDNTWLIALQLIGARRVIVIDTLKPMLAAILGHTILGEPLPIRTVIGIIISTAGILIVSLERDTSQTNNQEPQATGKTNRVIKHVHVHETVYNIHDTDSAVEGSFADDEQLDWDKYHNNKSPQQATSHKISSVGYIYAAINVILDAYGSVLTKQFGSKMNTWEINLYRFGFAALVLGFGAVIANIYYRPWVISTLTGQNKQDFSLISDDSEHSIELSGFHGSENGNSQSTQNNRETRTDSVTSDEDGVKPSQPTYWFDWPFQKMTKIDWIYVSIGVLFVTFTCPSLANYALFHIDLSLCLTLTSLGPIYSLPLVYIMRNEKITQRAISGTLLAFFGIVIMCFRFGNHMQPESPNGPTMDIQDFLVPSLPGWSYSLPSKQYSGLFQCKSTTNHKEMSTHFWFVESQSKPANDPIIVWMDVGPSIESSSLYNMFHGIGPLTFTSDNELVYNDDSWTLFANVLMISAPNSMSFTDCGHHNRHGKYEDCFKNSNDILELFEQSLIQWISIFNENYPNNEIIFAGNALAGVYIIDFIERLDSFGFDNIIGWNNRTFSLSIDNPCFPHAICDDKNNVLLNKDVVANETNTKYLSYELFHNLFGRNAISNDLWFSMIRNNCFEKTSENGMFRRYLISNEDSHCLKHLESARSQIGRYSSYNFYVDKSSCNCQWKSFILWMNSENVKTALHVPLKSTCDHSSEFQDHVTNLFTDNTKTLSNIITSILKITSQMKYYSKTLFFIGDVNIPISVPIVENMLSLSLDMSVLDPWHPWTLDGCQHMGGYVTSYNSNISLVSVRGAGRWIVLDSPRELSHAMRLTLMESKESLKPFDISCVRPQ